MTVLGLDLNATRLRGVAGSDAPLTLDAPRVELALAASAEVTKLEVGSPALRRSRIAPHRVRLGYLARLGRPRPSGDPFSPEAALGLVFRKVRAACRRGRGVVLALPPYLDTQQVNAVFRLAEGAGLPVLGGLSATLALATAAGADRPTLVLDCDDHALTLSAVAPAGGQLELLAGAAVVRLGLGAWRERVLGAVAELCIRQCRRDPRDCADAEQAIYDHLDDALDACAAGRAAHVVAQASGWYQSVTLAPADAAAWCGQLVRLSLAEVAAFLSGAWSLGAPRLVVCGADAGRLPGLVPALRSRLQAQVLTGPPAAEDFGEGLLDFDDDEPALAVLPHDAAARSAQALADVFRSGELPSGYLDESAPLPQHA